MDCWGQVVPTIAYFYGIAIRMFFRDHPPPRERAARQDRGVWTMIKVSKIRYLDGYRVRPTFSDGMAGEYDFSAVVKEGGPMVEPLRDRAYFARVFFEDGARTWPNGYDAAPGWLRREIETTGTLARDAVA